MVAVYAGAWNASPRLRTALLPSLPRVAASVLIVEDEALVRASGVGLFADAGFRPIEAESGDDAIEVLNANSEVQLLFTDVDLPGTIDGLALAWYVRTKWPHNGIIFVSGRFVPKLRELPGGARFHQKPYDPDAVIRHARELTAA
jgi:two-component system, response regulator PdtaR